MNVVLCYRERELGFAWQTAFDGIAGIQIVEGDICRLPCDAIVSPANSFGFMDGGLDHLLSERFGWDLEKRVQAAIQSRPMRELLIGEAIVVPTEDIATPWLVCAPTMRVPMRIRASINAYLAMKAALLAARDHTSELKIGTLAVPGLGTGIGQLASELAATQMARAYKEVILGEETYPGSFAEAQRLHVQLNRTALLYD